MGDSFGTFLETYRIKSKNDKFKEEFQRILDDQSEHRRTKIYQLISNERQRQNHLHPSPMENPLAVLGEEYGEVCRAIFEKDIDNLVEELIEVAAVAVRYLEELEI